MRCQIRIAVCTLLMIACCSGVVFSQTGSDKEFNKALYDELQTSEDEMVRFTQTSIQTLMEGMQQNVQTKAVAAVMERMKDTSTPMTQEEGMKIGIGVAIDELIGLQKPINDKASEFFSEEGRQKMHLRFFQAKTGLMDRLGEIDDLETVQTAFGVQMMQLMGGQPDFLELRPEQSELVTKQLKETSVEAMMLTTQATVKMITAHPEKLTEIQRLVGEMQNADSDEEQERIAKELQAVNGDIFKDIAPELKTILIKGHEDYMRVMTDAQKAKIKAIMADMPDYMKNKLAEVGKGGGALSLDSWVPGMGVPGVNPNREAPRQRSGGGRAFPGN